MQKIYFIMETGQIDLFFLELVTANECLSDTLEKSKI